MPHDITLAINQTSLTLAVVAAGGGGGGGGVTVATDTIWDAKGDLVVGSGSDAAAVLSIGANGTVLMADTAQPQFVKWAALTKSDVGLANVDNTADASKIVASAAAWTTARTLTIGGTGKSVDGSAAVTWTIGEIGAAAASHSHAWSDITSGKPTTLSGYGITDGVATGRVIATDNGLQGGGALSSDLTLSVIFGAGALTVCEGNDARLSNARTPTSHTHPASDISDSTAAGRTIVTAADAAAQRSALGIPTIFVGSAAPNPANGSNGDLYFQF